MPHITSIESIGLEMGFEQGFRRGFEQGFRQGMLEIVPIALEIRFGSAGLELLPELQMISDIGVLRSVGEAIKTATTLDEVRRCYRPQATE